MSKKKNSRNASGTMSIRQRSGGRWEVRITTGIDYGTGKQKQKSFYGLTQKEAVQKAKEYQANITNGIFTEPTKMTLGEWLDVWLSEYTGNVKETTLAIYAQLVKNHIKPYLGAVKLQALTAPQIQTVYNGLGKGEDHLAPKTIKNVHGVIHKALDQSVRVGYIRFNPADNVTLPKIIKPELKPLTDETLTAFLSAIEGHRFETLFKVDLFTGMRKGELLGLSWDCVDFQKNTILVKQQLIQEKKKGGAFKITTTKNGKTRTLSPAPSVMQMLSAQKAKQNEMRLRLGSAWHNPMNLVFTDETGKHLSHTTVSHNFKRIMKSLGLPDTRFHDLRHSYAVLSLQSGDDIKTVQENLGHYTAAFTLDVYGHVSERMKRESADRMERFIKSVNAQ